MNGHRARFQIDVGAEWCSHPKHEELYKSITIPLVSFLAQIRLLSNLNELKSAESTLKLLMAAGDYSAALDVLDSFEGMLDSKDDSTAEAKDSKSSRVDINNVNLLLCFRSLPLYLKTARQEVDRALTDDLIREVKIHYSTRTHILFLSSE